MICKNCGNEMEENAVFCGKCGSRVEEEPATVEEEETTAVETQNTEDVCDIAPEVAENDVNTKASAEVSEEVAPEVSDEKPPVKKKKKKWVIWTAIVLVVAILTTGVVFAFPYISNTFWSIVLSDEDYFKHVVENNVSDYADEMADAYAEVMEMYKNGETFQYDAKIEVGKKTKDLVDDYSYGDVNIDWLNSISIKGQSGYKDGKIYQDATYSINDKQFTDYNMIMDDDAMYMDFPGLSDGGIRIEHEDGSEIMLQAVVAFYEVSPDVDVFKDLFVRYINCLTEGVTDVEKTSDTIQAGEVSKKYKKLSATIDEDVVEKAIETVLEEAKEDEDIKKLITDFCNSNAINADANDVYEEFQDGIDDLIDELDVDGDFEFYFNIWVDAKGDIVGMGVDFDGGEVYYANALDWNNLGTILEIDVSGFNASFEGSGKMESNKFNGSYNLEVMGMEVADIKLVNIDYPLIKDGIFNGKVEVTVAEDIKKQLKATGDKAASMLADAKIVMDFKGTEKYKDIVEIAVSSGSDNFVTLSVNADVVKAEVPTISKYISSKNYSKVTEWSGTLGMNAIEKLKEHGFDIFSLYSTDEYSLYY